ncbi:MAG: mandelate racemase/muconate lactonizing enzyme family protein [Pseudomonadota bacterium]
MTVTLTRVEAVPLSVSFAEIFGGPGNIPPEIARPASHFQAIPRKGQSSTFVFCEASDGARGTGESFGLPIPQPVAAFVNRVAAEALVGRALTEPHAMTADLRAFFLALGHSRGPAMEALSGIDIALWDLTARRVGRPLAELLGARVKAVPAYVSPVPFLGTPEESAAAARRLIKGFGALKLKVGRGAREDVPHIAAVREAVGRDIALMLDANCGYTLDGARELLWEIAPLDIRWLEEPLPPEDLEGLAALARLSPIPIAGGENEFTHEGIGRLATQAGLAVLQPNITRIGGISGMLAVDAFAARTSATIAPHGVGGCIAVAATLHVAAAMERFDLFEVNRLPNPLRDGLGRRWSIDANGAIRPPPGDGHGSPVNEDKLHDDARIRAVAQ